MGNSAPPQAIPAGTTAGTGPSANVVVHQPVMGADPPPYVPSSQSHNPDTRTPLPLVGNPATPAQNVVYGGTPNTAGNKAAAVAPNGTSQMAYPVATPLNSLGTRPLPVDCPFCGMRGLTIVEPVHSSMTHITALLCCLLCICLVFVPYATGMGDDTEHRCGACRKLLAIARNNGRVEVVAYAPPVLVKMPGQHV